MREHKYRHLQPLIDIAYFVLDKNDVKTHSHSKEEFMEIAKEVGNPGTIGLFFALFRAVTKIWPYYINQRIGVAPMTARLYREHQPK